MKKVIWIGVAGAAGALMRVAAGQVFVNESNFPIVTLCINLIGTFLLCLITIGSLTKLKMNKDIQEILMTGFLGAFTTFSAVSMETIELFTSGQPMVAFLYITTSMIGGLLAAIVGFHLGRKKVDE